MNSAANKLNLPNFLIASSPELLREKMLENNLRMGAEVSYQDIQVTQSGDWVAWFYEAIELTQLFPKAKERK